MPNPSPLLAPIAGATPQLAPSLGKPSAAAPQGGEPPQDADSGEFALLLASAIVEALVTKGVITEEDVHTALNSLTVPEQPNENATPSNKPQGKMSGGSPGFPGGVDPNKVASK